MIRWKHFYTPAVIASRLSAVQRGNECVEQSHGDLFLELKFGVWILPRSGCYFTVTLIFFGSIVFGVTVSVIANASIS